MANPKVAKTITQTHMKAKKENYWNMFRLLLLVNVVLITAMILVQPGKPAAVKNQEPCSSSSAKKVNAEVLNAITVKLM